jgi:4'-phosphopantetheinyl transferase
MHSHQVSLAHTTGAAVATVWLVNMCTIEETLLNACAAWLSTGESARYQRFVRPLRQRQFLAGRILLRLALAELLHVPPQIFCFSERPDNAPLLDWPLPGPAPGFSISHSGPWVACAVSLTVQLGLDIEVINPLRDVTALAMHSFDADIINWLTGQPESARVSAFYTAWCRQEAIYKLACVIRAGPQLQDDLRTQPTAAVTDGSAPTAPFCEILQHPGLSVVVASHERLTATPAILLTRSSPFLRKLA